MRAAFTDCIVYAGPSRAGSTRLPDDGLPGVEWRPPICFGDLEQLVQEFPPATVAIVDGVFHHRLPVSHREILRALEGGWEVWGLSSMGAIRACELRAMGMRGFGRVYERFVVDELRDDEVALLHEAEPPYRLLTEPLIHLRCATEELVRTGQLHPSRADDVLGELGALWFGDRTLARYARTVSRVEPRLEGLLREQVRNFQPYRLKTLDLERFIHTRPWANEAPLPGPS
jgi:hypothetical protein